MKRQSFLVIAGLVGLFHVLTAQVRKEFLLEKGKERNRIALFIKTLSQLPIQLTLNYYVTAISYYIIKFNVFKLSINNKVILIY